MNGIIGFDIGGANIKWFHSSGVASSVPFAIWKHPQLLAAAMNDVVTRLPTAARWAVTMTGEMADCFGNREQGVRFIVAQVMDAARKVDCPDVRFYSSAGSFLSDIQAGKQTANVASANWHALAKWVASWIKRDALLIDVGTTTADIISLSPGIVETTSITDHDRLRRGELVYVGGKRTPVCALVQTLPLRGTEIPVMREVFANTGDCSLILGWSDEDENDLDTCDGRPRTRIAAVNRLAHLIGLDYPEMTLADAEQISRYVMQCASDRIEKAIRQHRNTMNRQWILSGHAKGLIPSTFPSDSVDLMEQLGPDVARVGPAFAVCKLIELDRAR